MSNVNSLTKDELGVMISNDTDYYPFTNDKWSLYRPTSGKFIEYRNLLPKYRLLMDKYGKTYRELVQIKHSITGTHNNVPKSGPGIGDAKIMEAMDLILSGKLDKTSPNYNTKWSAKWQKDFAKDENQSKFKNNLLLTDNTWIEQGKAIFERDINESLEGLGHLGYGNYLNYIKAQKRSTFDTYDQLVAKPFVVSIIFSF